MQIEMSTEAQKLSMFARVEKTTPTKYTSQEMLLFFYPTLKIRNHHKFALESQVDV